MRSSWIAVHVQTATEEHLKDDAKDRIQETLSLAERLGAEVVVLPGALDVAAELLNYARSAMPAASSWGSRASAASAAGSPAP